MPLLSKNIDIVGVPSDLGANVRGACMGPSAIRIAKLHTSLGQFGLSFSDKGDVAVPVPETLYQHFEGSNHLCEITQINYSLKSSILETLRKEKFPLVLGGDHSLAIGSLAAVLAHYGPSNVGVVWVDTHSDINTPDSSETLNIHGMPISVLMGQGYSELVDMVHGHFLLPQNVHMIGLRSVDEAERKVLLDSGVNFYTMRDVDEHGIQYILQKVCNALVGLNTHVSFDLDVIDPSMVPGVSTAVPGGLTLRESHLILEMLHENLNISSMDLVELNVFKDLNGKSAYVAVDLIMSLLGKRIV